ncbi:hypothetical protein [uncultured Roseobacter sp.]|uniref:hypothetical protein n=1 Tax=uncultured Roseobacter sp. TaxID=114847 RepID=UPI0026281758|nr:hypothetical protein [uncultured Roseobacter sp.]
MVAYSFQPGFAPLILSGVKTSTIWPPRKVPHAKLGQTVHCFTGLRSENCVRLLEAPCIKSVPLEIWPDCVVSDGRRMDNPEYYRTLARIEGFDQFGNLQAWFDRRYGLPVRDLTQIAWDFSAADFIAEMAGATHG